MKGSLKICRPREIFFYKKNAASHFYCRTFKFFFFLAGFDKKNYFSQPVQLVLKIFFWFSDVDFRVEVNFAPCVALLHGPSCDIHLQDQKIVVTFTYKAIVLSMFFLPVLTLVCERPS